MPEKQSHRTKSHLQNDIQLSIVNTLNTFVANEVSQTRAYQYYVTVCLSAPCTKQFCEAPAVTVQLFVCLSVAMTTRQGNRL